MWTSPFNWQMGNKCRWWQAPVGHCHVGIWRSEGEPDNGYGGVKTLWDRGLPVVWGCWQVRLRVICGPSVSIKLLQGCWLVGWRPSKFTSDGFSAANLGRRWSKSTLTPFPQTLIFFPVPNTTKNPPKISPSGWGGRLAVLFFLSISIPSAQSFPGNL